MAPGGPSAGRRAGPGSTRTSARTHSGTRSSPPPKGAELHRMQHSVSGVRTAQQGMRVRERWGGDRDHRTNQQARTVVTGPCCVRCQDVASILVAPESSMLQQEQRKTQRRGQMPPPVGRHADPFSMVGKPLPTSSETSGHNRAELERRLGHANDRYLRLYTNPPDDVAAGYVEDL
jgi:hypothetical protein